MKREGTIFELKRQHNNGLSAIGVGKKSLLFAQQYRKLCINAGFDYDIYQIDMETEACNNICDLSSLINTAAYNLNVPIDKLAYTFMSRVEKLCENYKEEFFINDRDVKHASIQLYINKTFEIVDLYVNHNIQAVYACTQLTQNVYRIYFEIP